MANLFVIVKRKITELLRGGLAVGFMFSVKDQLLDTWYSVEALYLFSLRVEGLLAGRSSTDQAFPCL